MKIRVSENWLSVAEAEILVEGSIGVYHIDFEFDDTWVDYSTRAVFESPGLTPIEMQVTDAACEIPWEVLADHRKKFRVGIYGLRDGDRRPTLWSEYFPVSPGTSAGIAARPAPTPDIYEQLVESISASGDAKEHAAAAAADARNAEAQAERAERAAQVAENIVGVGAVQSDWLVNAPDSKAYIQNRPFYRDGTTVVRIPEEFMPQELTDAVNNALSKEGGTMAGDLKMDYEAGVVIRTKDLYAGGRPSFDAAKLRIGVCDGQEVSDDGLMMTPLGEGILLESLSAAIYYTALNTDLYMTRKAIKAVADPVDAHDVATKKYVDDRVLNLSFVIPGVDTLLTDSWKQESVGYSLVLDMSNRGLRDDDTPIVDVQLGDDLSKNAEYLSAWAQVTRIAVSADRVTVYADAIPTVDVPVQMKVVR